jgi:hypothetical protein
VLHAAKQLGETRKRVKEQRVELAISPTSTAEHLVALEARHVVVEELALLLLGDPNRERLHEAQSLSIKGLTERIAAHLWETTQAPTTAQREMMARASAKFEAYIVAFAALDFG